MSGEVPEGWSRHRLGDIIDIANDSISADAIGKLAAVAHYSLPAFDDARAPDITAGLNIKSNKSLVPPDCVLFSKLNPRIPRVWRVAERSQLPSVCSTEFWPLVARSDEIDLDFLTAFVGSEAFLGDPQITPSSSTNSHQRVDRRSFENYVLPLPPLDEQRRIAEVLRSVDEAIEAQEKVCGQLSAAFSSTVEACFTAANWPEHSLGDLCASIQVGIVVRPASYYVESGGVPALRSLNVLENGLGLDDLVYISEAGHAANQKSSLRAGDVVTRRTGEPGKTAMIPTGFENGLNCIDIIFSRPKDCLRSAYLSFFMNSDAAKRQVAGLQGGLAQQHLNVGEMRKLTLPLPDLQTQDRTVEILADMGTSMEASRHALLKLSALKTSLATDLLSGSVRIPA